MQCLGPRGGELIAPERFGQDSQRRRYLSIFKIKLVLTKMQKHFKHWAWARVLKGHRVFGNSENSELLLGSREEKSTREQTAQGPRHLAKFRCCPARPRTSVELLEKWSDEIGEILCGLFLKRWTFLALREKKERNRKNLELVKRLVELLKKGIVSPSTKAGTVGQRKGRIWEESGSSVPLVH